MNKQNSLLLKKAVDYHANYAHKGTVIKSEVENISYWILFTTVYTVFIILGLLLVVIFSVT